jgi:hypothetical protein
MRSGYASQECEGRHDRGGELRDGGASDGMSPGQVGSVPRP